MNNKNLRYLWLTIAVLLSFFIGGKWNIPLAAWIAPIFFIRFFRDSEKVWRSLLLLWVASAIPTIISWRGATAMNFGSPLVEPIFFLLTTPIMLIPNVVDRLYYRRFGSSAWLTLVYPICFTAMDFFSASGSPFGTFGASAYAQRGFVTAMQIASVAGLWGIPFVMSWLASAVNHIWESRASSNRFRVAFAALLILILGLGFGRTMLADQPTQSATIAGFSLPVGKLHEILGQQQTADDTAMRQAVDELHAAQLDQIRSMADAGAEIVALQEGAGMGATDQVEALISGASAIAKEKNIYVVLPTFDIGKTPPENVVSIIDPTGAVALTHVKYGGNQFEGTLKGDGVLQTIDTPYGKLSAIICWDADFPNAIKQAGAQNVDLLFVPSNDWREVKDIHAGMATFRAVENGMTIFRQTGDGVSLVADPYGRTLNRVDIFQEDVVGFTSIQTVSTPIGSISTLYPTVGDGVGYLMLVGFVGLLVGLLVTRKKGQTTETGLQTEPAPVSPSPIS